MENEQTNPGTYDPEPAQGFSLSSLRNPKILWSLIIFLVLIGIFLVYNTIKTPTNTSDVSPDNQMIPPTLVPTTPPSIAHPTVSPAPSVESLSVSYRPAKRLPKSILLSDGPHSTELALQSIGFVQEGRYKNWALIRSEQPHYRTKGGGGISLQYLRFLLNYTSLVYLPRASDPVSALAFDISGQKNQERAEAFPEDTIKEFAQAGYTLTIDEQITIPELDYPSTVSGPNGSQFTYTNEGEGVPDKTLLIEAFTEADGTPMWTTKSGRGPTAFFYTGEEPTPLVSPAIGCRGSRCFTSNGFYRFRPDGTFTIYTYQLPFNPQMIHWNTSYADSQTAEFASATRIGCGPLHADVTSITPPDILPQSDLTSIGTFNNGTGLVYGLKDTNHSFLKQFYAAYSGEVPEWWRTKKFPVDTYEEFVARNPVFFFRDPFDRLIRLTNTRYTPPYACEPILYVYPEKPMDISIRFDLRVRMLASTPSYADGWHVTAHPDGSIINLHDAHEYPYLFWEGHAGTIPPRNEGFVLAQKNIGEFFRKMLPELGLNEKESDDFIAAWEPRLSDAPYYRISFLFSGFLNEYAPIVIHPKPDTIIRIWIDYQPLHAFAPIPAQQLPKAPARQGFTVVEWGGLTR